MKDVINECKNLSSHIKQTEEYRQYMEKKNMLLKYPDLKYQLGEFKKRNNELQNRQGINPYDEVVELVKEYTELIHNSVVSDFMKAELRLCKMMQELYAAIAEGLEFDYFDE
ncbi:MAG: YlbF family regulator [Clostridium sp.]|nr:YlbF family regulator [Clostridium sp.]MCM1398190.1 YlbF family regulator [Clostridium sp.]MCM1460396.1 YlbF family regulator [Bacteroides sp.]